MISGKKKAVEKPKTDDDDKGNPSVEWHGEKRSNATHRSTTDPDSRLATKSHKTAALPSYVVNGTMENRNRILTGIGVELFTGKAERDGAIGLLDRAKSRYKLSPSSLGGDKGYFVKTFAQGLLDRKISPHLATMEKDSGEALMRVRMRCRGVAFQMSQRARKKIEELCGEGKELHGLRRFARRQLENVRQEAFMIGWVLNLKRIATLQAAV